MPGGWADAQTQRLAERRAGRGEDLEEDAFAAGHLHLSPTWRGRGSATARG